jgi:hypothetical protein
MAETRGFFESLIEHRNGGCAIDMQQAVEEVVKGVRETGKGGKVVLTLAIKPATKGAGEVDTVLMSDSIKVDVPKLAKKETVFFVNEDNGLSRQDQRQMHMLEGIKDLDVGPRPAPKEVR